MIQETIHTTGQAAVRLSLLVLAALALLARDSGFDVVLGAFAAGIVVGVAIDGPSGEPVRARIEGIAFGFLVPIYFIVTGMTFDIDSLLSAKGLALAALFLGLLLLARGASALLWVRRLRPRETAGLAILGATGLPLIVAIVGIGTDRDAITPQLGASLVGAGMISVLALPLLGMAVLGRETGEQPQPHAGRDEGRGRGARGTVTVVSSVELETPHGPARAHLHLVADPRAALVLGHGAGGGVGAPDLVAASRAAQDVGLAVALVEQPYASPGGARRRLPISSTQPGSRSSSSSAVRSWPGCRSSPAAARQAPASRAARQRRRVRSASSASPSRCGRRDATRRSRCRAASTSSTPSTVPVLVIQGERDPFGMPPDGPRRHGRAGCRRPRAEGRSRRDRRGCHGMARVDRQPAGATGWKISVLTSASGTAPGSST